MTRGHKVKPLSTNSIRNTASIIRKALGSQSGYIDIQIILEFVLPTMLDDFEYEIVEKSTLGSDHARTYPLQNKIQIREDVYDGLCAGSGRDRFTVTHEIGHLFLHRDEAAYARNKNSRETHKIFEDTEWQADTFAAEFLMPYSDNLLAKTADEISKEYGVSYQAASYRLEKLRKN